MPTSLTRAPKQDRSRAALERLLEATKEILCEGTFEQLTIAGISKRSGVSVGSIYARFEGKDDLFLATMVDVLEALDLEWSAEIADLKARKLPLPERIPVLIDTLAEFLRRHAGMLRPFMVRANDPRVAFYGKASHQKLVDSFKELLLESKSAIKHSLPERAVDSCFSIVYASLARFLGLGSAADAAGEGDWVILKEDLGSMCMGFLLHPDVRLSR